MFPNASSPVGRYHPSAAQRKKDTPLRSASSQLRLPTMSLPQSSKKPYRYSRTRGQCHYKRRSAGHTPRGSIKNCPMSSNRGGPGQKFFLAAAHMTNITKKSEYVMIGSFSTFSLKLKISEHIDEYIRTFGYSTGPRPLMIIGLRVVIVEGTDLQDQKPVYW